MKVEIPFKMWKRRETYSSYASCLPIGNRPDNLPTFTPIGYFFESRGMFYWGASPIECAERLCRRQLSQVRSVNIELRLLMRFGLDAMAKYS